MRHAPFVVLLLSTLLAAPLQAVDYVVTRYDDPFPEGCLAGDCSLREAVIAANDDGAQGAPLDRIFLSAGDYRLDRLPAEGLALGGDLDVVDHLEIIGVGAGLTRIVVEEERAFEVTRINSFSLFPTLVLRGVTFGGVSLGDGSAAWVHDGTLEVDQCAVGSPFATPGNTIGPDIFLVTGESTLMIRRSTLAGLPGGAIQASGGAASVQIENSTISRFRTQALNASLSASIACRHCTIFEPDPFRTAASATNGATITFANSVVEVEACHSASGGSISSLGGNVEVPNDTCSFNLGSDLPASTASGLLAPADNGGPTITRGLASDSPAIGAGVGANCLPKDQRDATRKVPILGCDAGAFERVNKNPPTPLFHDGFEQGHLAAWNFFVLGT